jgi:hypothetical protein
MPLGTSLILVVVGVLATIVGFATEKHANVRLTFNHFPIWALGIPLAALGIFGVFKLPVTALGPTLLLGAVGALVIAIVQKQKKDAADAIANEAERETYADARAALAQANLAVSEGDVDGCRRHLADALVIPSGRRFRPLAVDHNLGALPCLEWLLEQGVQGADELDGLVDRFDRDMTRRGRVEPLVVEQLQRLLCA